MIDRLQQEQVAMTRGVPSADASIGRPSHDHDATYVYGA